jgi:hypothetical protein
MKTKIKKEVRENLTARINAARFIVSNRISGMHERRYGRYKVCEKQNYKTFKRRRF